MAKKLIIVALLFSQLAVSQTISWPVITQETKPWTRWWWPGSIVTPADLTASMEMYRNAGLGGMELTVLYGVKGEENRFIQFLSPEWMKMFEFSLNEAKRLDLGIDLANSSSWPFGGKWVNENIASKYVAYKTYSLKEGESLREKVFYIQEPWVKWNGTYRSDIKGIIDPIYKNDNLQQLAIDQIRFEKPIPLQVLMAYSDSGQKIDLTQSVDTSGNLNWTAPFGTWTLYAVFEGWHGKMVERAGPGGEGLVIDHFSDEAITSYLSHFDSAFKGFDIKYLRGYFNDSYEVDDAKGQACWTPDFFKQFKTRRGYDLKENLAALFQKDDPEKNKRVLCDYRHTISDLILDKFTRGWTSWAEKQGKITRNQAHGSPGNILDLYAASDIPETEGTDIFRMKFATSAANVTGKKYASAEAATWLGEHFSSSLLDVKKAVDQYFIAGVNHIVYHGTCLSPKDDIWPGFLFYAAVEFTPANSFWDDFPILNNYVTRVQSFLQNSKPDNDILLWFPIFDRYSDYINLMLEHFDAISPRYEGSHFKSAAEIMNRQGYSFDYISDLQIEGLKLKENLLNTGGVNYQTLVIPECKYIPIETFSRIINLAENGATIIFYGKIPEDISGWNDLAKKRSELKTFVEQIRFNQTGKNDIKEAFRGKGRILSGSNLELLLSYAKIRREPIVSTGLKFTRRKTNEGNLYFILNQSEKTYAGWVSISAKSQSVAIFNPMDENKGIATTEVADSGLTRVYLKLAPYQSAIIKTFSTKITGNPYINYDPAGIPQELAGTWKIKFIKGGPVLPKPLELTRLVSWTQFEDDDYKDFSGTAEYSTIFKRPRGNATAWTLDLGKVSGSARIFLNDKELIGLIGPDYQVVISNKNLKTENKLSIRVSNLMANRIAYLDRNKVQWKKFYNVNFPAKLRQNSKNGLFDASSWQPIESGLIGPVTLTPMKKH